MEHKEITGPNQLAEEITSPSQLTEEKTGPSQLEGITSANISRSLQEKLKVVEDPTVINEEQVSKPKIQMVSPILREKDNFKKYFEPVILAIGPIHHDNLKVKQTEPLKLRLAHDFIKENRLNKEDLCKMIMMAMENFKQCYDKEVIETYADDQLAMIFLVDGCAVLHFIYCLADGVYPNKLDLNIRRDKRVFMLRDMFLLENQLPYQLLELLISSAESRNLYLRHLITAFVVEMVARTTTAPSPERKEPYHLLDILRDCLIIAPPKKDNKRQNLTAGRLCFAKGSGEQEEFKRGKNQYPTFRNVCELQASGIKFKASNTRLLTDVSFAPGCFFGTLRLPRFHVTGITASKFLNLVAYEMCPDFTNGLEVISYMCFLDSLIDFPEDVQELRKVNILHNRLGSDKELAKLFNEISTDLVPNSSLYQDVKEEIEKI